MSTLPFRFNTLSRAMKPLLLTSASLALSMNSICYAQSSKIAASSEESKTIVIVGSRIRKTDFRTDHPIDVLYARDAIKQGINSTAEFLRRATLSAGSAQVTSATSISFVQSGGSGAETISLRGLGANRTLVLLNGRRAGPAGTRGEVSSFDFNVLPLSAIDRIEILKDGASSVYGSDAVAGVVNIITKWGEGGNVDVFKSQPFESGGEQSRINFSWGKELVGSSFRVTVDYDQKNELARGDRDYFACSERYVFDQNTGERFDSIDPRTGKYHCNDLAWGQVWLYDYQDPGGNVPGESPRLAQYDYDNNLAQYLQPYAVDPTNAGYLVAPANWYPVAYDLASDGLKNADHPFQQLQSFDPKSTRATIYAQGKMDVGDSMQGYAEVLLNRRETSTNGYRQFWGYVYNGSSDGLFPENPLNADWQGYQWLSPVAITDHSSENIAVDYQRYTLGLNGEIKSWFWDVSLQSTRSEGEYKNAIIYKDAIRDQDELAGSCVGSNTSFNNVPCVDIPWLDPQFLAGNISQQMRDFLFSYDVGKTTYTQNSIEGYLTGDVMELDAGTVSAAVGIHLREDKLTDTPGLQTRNGNSWGSSSAGITKGSDKTKAVFVEADIPLFSDDVTTQSLDLKLSARYTDVDSYGSGSTYKVGLNWQATDTINFRTSRGTSFRTPALYELFLAEQTSFLPQRQVDPCINWGGNLSSGAISQRLADNCAADGIAADFTGASIGAVVTSSGGLGELKAETSLSQTFGVVWKPNTIDLQLSLDYFDFLIEDEVTQLGTNITFGCYRSANFANDPLCDLFTRDASDQRIDTMVDDFLNIAKQRNRGWDLSVNYQTDFDIGRLVIDSQHTYQTRDLIALTPDISENTNGEFGEPRYVGNMNLGLEKDLWAINWNIRYIGAVSNVNRDDGELISYRNQLVRAVKSAPGFTYHDLSFSYDFKQSGLYAIVGISNIFDKKPPRVSTIGSESIETAGNAAFYSQYDNVGRTIFVNVSYDFD